ncbi:MAG: efflux RND transporter periplasmic adaptor subunit [Gammaproteobacteria bacterium]|nr:efflux RND transporter periplasmic adaptor subunit [Gammaproteobacteria bacterium]
MNDFKTWILQIIALIIASLLLLGCTESDLKQQQKEIVRPAKIATVEPANGSSIKTFTATVEPTQDAQLAFRVNGEIIERLVVAGVEVEKGQVLARLDDQDFKLQVKQAKARYDLMQSQFNRAQTLFKDKLIASSAYDEAQAQLDIAEAQLDAAKTNLEYTTLKAPFSGIVAQVHVEPFEFIQAKQPIMELQGRDTVDVAIQVPEALMARIPKSKETNAYQPTLILDAKPDTQFKVTSREHDITPNPATKSYKVVFSFKPPQDINVLAGMTGKLYVEMDKLIDAPANVFVVPVESVFLPNKYAGEDKHFVYRLTENNVTELHQVSLIRLSQQGAIIQAINDNIKVNDRVIAAGSHLIAEGQKVTPWTRERGL